MNSDPHVQVQAGLEWIAERYGSGGDLLPGIGVAVNYSGRPETVMTWEGLQRG